MRKIIFSRTSTGHCPVEKFLDLLPSKHAQKVSWVLSLIEDLPMVQKQYFKKLINTDDIWEVRVKSGGEAYRLLGFFDGTKSATTGRTGGMRKPPKRGQRMVAHQTKIRISKHEIRQEVTRSEAKALTISAQQYQMAKIQMTKTPHHARAWPQKDGSGCMFQTLQHSNFEFFFRISIFGFRV